MEKVKIVILAAGKGKRIAPLGYDLPKPLIPIHGKPMVEHVIDAAKQSGVDAEPVVVTAPDTYQLFQQTLNLLPHQTVIQEEQLGTGHAVMCAQGAFNGAEDVMVLYADHPTLRAETIKHLAEEHQASGATLTLMTVKFPDYQDWRQWFTSYGRIIRDTSGNIARIVEAKDASEEEQKITEVNPGYMIFKRGWLCEHIELLTNKNAQGEYYLTDLLQLAVEQHQLIHTLVVDDAIEAIGINTPEQFKAAEEALKNSK